MSTRTRVPPGLLAVTPVALAVGAVVAGSDGWFVAVMVVLAVVGVVAEAARWRQDR